MKTVKFFTLGCKVNQYDTQALRESFVGAGFRELENAQAADIYLVNTCTVTKNADSDSLGYVRRAHRENPRARIIVTGCLAELDKDKIASQPGVSLVIKNKDKSKIINVFNQSTSQPANQPTISTFKGHTRAFLKIQDGCDNFCSYCKVPMVRGRPRSKQPGSVIKEAEKLTQNGFREIVLTGICLGAYGKDLFQKDALARLIKDLEKIPKLLRIRLSSIEALDVTDTLISTIASSSKVCPHLHIPLQSADNEILKAMRRRYTRKEYLSLIAKIKKRIPGIAITTDVLVGFPGESEVNFRNTLRAVRKMAPLRVHVFGYSHREQTKAANLKNTLNPALVKERVTRLSKLSRECALKYCQAFLGEKISVLVESRCKESPGFWEGYAGNYIKLRIKSKRNLANCLLEAKLEKICQGFAYARLTKPV